MTRRRGFTLLELTLSMLIMAMIALTLYSCLNTAFRARNQAVDQIRGPRRAAVTLDLIAADFQSVVKPGTALGGTFTGYAMGSPSSPTDSVSFVCLGKDDATTAANGNVQDTSDPYAVEGPRGVTLTLKTDGGTSRLVREVQRHLLATALPPMEEEVLAEGVRSFSVRYYSDTGWTTEWDSDTAGGLPLAVEILIEIDAPITGAPENSYRATRLIPLSIGGTPARATAAVTP